MKDILNILSTNISYYIIYLNIIYLFDKFYRLVLSILELHGSVWHVLFNIILFTCCRPQLLYKCEMKR